MKPSFAVYSSFDQFEISGLWPGRWTVAARSGEEVLATASAEIFGTEKVHFKLAARSEEAEGP